MIKAGDLVGWSEGYHGEHPRLDELDDCGVVVSVHARGVGVDLREIKRIKIAWIRDPDESVDEYPFDWAIEEVENRTLVILSQS